MCWISRYKPIRHIAEEDIICYKVFENRDIIYGQNSLLGFKYGKRKIQKLFSICRNFKYIPYKKQKHINLEFTHSCYYLADVIYEGYHSYATLDRAKYMYRNNNDVTIIECIIPKDTEYYINEEYEIVSSTIIVTDKIVYCKN